MRLLSATVTVAMLVGAALSGFALWTELSAQPVANATTPKTAEAEAQPPRQAASRLWPALFGEPQPPAPQPPTPQPVEPARNAPPKPPLSSLGYSLSGVVTTDTGTWALLSHPAGGKLVKVGDALERGVEVVRIDADGLWLSRDGDAPELLAFAEAN